MKLTLEVFVKHLEDWIKEQEDPERAKQAEIDYVDFYACEWDRTDICYNKENNIITIH